MAHPIAIIGAGPLGIELAIALKRAGLAYVHFDAKQIGQTISWFPPQTRFFSSNERIAIAGVPLQTPDQTKATREQYLAYLRSVVQQFDLRINTYEPVTSIRAISEGFELTTEKGGEARRCVVSKIVLATGGTAWPRRLDVPGEDLPHVHKFWNDPHDYFGQRVLVVGGKNSAVETALRLNQAGAIVSMCYRRSELPAKHIKYWLMPEIASYLKSGRITGYFNHVVTRITPSHVALAPCGPDFGATDRGADLPFDFVLPQIGYEADMSLAKLAGVTLNADRHVPAYDPQTMESNVPGVYLCGTVTGGTQDRYEIFIENGHAHVEKILAHLRGERPHVEAPVYANPES
ncbi:MAG TPA: NAD(P)-binding domain-containing protein [Tepidisphaeraceae bacterium]|nr:NAD(P)-binding domain-containing protein [Tepidisphaeraceae bacterium]